MGSAKQIRLYGVLLLFTLMLMGWLYQLAQSDAETISSETIHKDYTEIHSVGRIIVATSYSAFAYDSTNSQLQTLIQTLSRNSGLDVNVVVEDNTRKMLDLLRAGEVDIIVKPLVRTSEIDTALFSWLHSEVSGPIYLVQRRDSTGQVSKQLDLTGKTIRLPQGSPQSIFLRHLSEEMGLSLDIEYDPVYNTEQIIMLVSAGEVDYTLCSESEATVYQELFPTLDFSLPVSHNLRRGWLIRKSSVHLRDSLRRWLCSSQETV